MTYLSVAYIKFCNGKYRIRPPFLLPLSATAKPKAHTLSPHPWRHRTKPPNATTNATHSPASMALSDLPLHHSFRLSSRPHLHLFPLRLLSSSRSASSSSSSSPAASASASSSSSSGNRAPPAPSLGAPWLQKWAPADPSALPPAPAPTTSIDRIVHRLRNLGLATDDDEPSTATATATAPLDGNERLGDLLDRSWARPDRQFATSSFDEAVLPWERNEENTRGRGEEEDEVKRRRVRAPTLAELTIEDEELRRLRRLGMTLRDRITVPKAGVTLAVTEKIHDAWRKSELVRLKFHEDLAHDMKTAHELVEVCAV